MSRNPELLVRSSHGESHYFPLLTSRTRVGRSWLSDVVLSDSRVARRHAEIRADGDDFMLEDLRTKGGTYVNGERIDGIVALENGDVITLGDQQLEFLTNVPDTAILLDTPGDLALEGTVVVPADLLLEAAHAQKDADLGHQRHRVPEGVSRATSARIERQNQILAALSELAETLSDERPPHEHFFDFVLELAFNIVKAERGALMIESDGELIPRAIRAAGEDTECHAVLGFSRAIADKVMTDKVSILTNNAMRDATFSGFPIISLRIRSAMCVPLWVEDSVMGLLYMDSLRRENSFGQDDLTLLTGLANLAAIELKSVTSLE